MGYILNLHLIFKCVYRLRLLLECINLSDVMGHPDSIDIMESHR